MDVVPSDTQVMDMTNCFVCIHRLDLPLDVVVKVPLWDEEHWEESVSSSEQGRSSLNSMLHEPVQEVKMDGVSSKTQVMDMMNCVVRIHRLDLPLDVVVKVPLWDEEQWDESASSGKENLTSSVFSEELGEALDWMSPYSSASASPVVMAAEDEEDTQEELAWANTQPSSCDVLGREAEKSRQRCGKGTRRCIVRGCKALVVHLPRHLRRVHQWSPQEAINADGEACTAARSRQTRNCVVEGCTAVVVHLPRHLRQVHHFGPSEALSAILGSSKKLRSQPSQRKNKLCPQKGCGRVRRNIYQHMRKFHKLEKGPKEWRTISKWNITSTKFSGDGSGLDTTTSSTYAEEGQQQKEAPKEDTASPEKQRSPSSSTTDKDSNAEIKACGRGTKSCIVIGCTAVVIHLPRHLRQVHQWNPQEARDAVQSLRKPWSPTSRPMKKCPVDGCGRMTQRVPQHLRKYHKLQISSLGRRNIRKAQVEFNDQDNSIHGLGVVERSEINSLELSDSGSGELPPPCSPTETCVEEGPREEHPQEDTVQWNNQRSPSSSAAHTDSNAEIKAHGRGTKSCIVSGCTAAVIHLPRHLRQVHQWNPQEARDAVQSLRKPWSPTSRPMKKCPVEGCGHMTQRVPQHLRKYHKLQIGSLGRRNIRKAQVEFNDQDRSINWPGVVESSKKSSSDLSDNGNGALPPLSPFTSSRGMEEGPLEESGKEDTAPPNNHSPCGSITEKESRNAELKVCGRGTKSCIVSGCTAAVIHLPRHLRQVHQWNPQEARDAVQSFRKPRSPTSRPVKKCPVEGCGLLTQRVPQHLRKYHKLQIGSQARSIMQDEDAC